MFGYIVPNRSALTEEQLLRYRSFYCGVCHALGDRYGKRGRLTLSYDMTFFALLISALYELQTRSDVCRCVLKPKEKHDYLSGEVLDYCADMNVALSYYKFLDDWQDDHKVAARTEARLLKGSMKKIEALYPQKIALMKEELKRLSDLERFESRDVDACAACTGKILGEIAVYREDRWADTLRLLGDSLGRFIYLMDAWDDFSEDQKKDRFNPLRPISEGEGFDERCHAILTMLISECTCAFETLPIVTDADLLRNILYSGVWARYCAKTNGKEGAGK